MIGAGTCVLALAVALNVCAAGHGKGDPMSGRSIDEVLRAHTRELMSLPGVVGTGRGECASRPCIKVYVRERNTGLEQRLPETIEGYPVEVEETGTIRPLSGEEQ